LITQKLKEQNKSMYCRDKVINQDGVHMIQDNLLLSLEIFMVLRDIRLVWFINMGSLAFLRGR